MLIVGGGDHLTREQVVDGDPQLPAQREQEGGLGEAVAPLPFGHRLVADAQPVGQLPLGEVEAPPPLGDEASDLDLIHGVLLSRPSYQSAGEKNTHGP